MAHPEEERHFSGAMTDYTFAVAPAVAENVVSLGLPENSVVADVGGALGNLLQFVMRANPTLQGILYDRESVIADAEPKFPEDLKARTKFVVVSSFK